MTPAVVFLAQATNTPLSMGDFLLVLAVSLVASKGAHGVPGLAIDWFIGMVRALGNLIGYCAAMVVVAAWETEINLPLAERVLDNDVVVEEARAA